VNAQDLLTDLQSRGVQISAEGDRLRIKAPRGAVTPELRERLARNKPDIIAALSTPESPDCRKSRESQRRKMTETGQKGLKSGVSVESATVTAATVATNPVRSRPELDAVCRSAISDFPGVDPARLRQFLDMAEDPAWCTERVARHIARRMSEGLIWELTS